MTATTTAKPTARSTSKTAKAAVTPNTQLQSVLSILESVCDADDLHIGARLLSMANFASRELRAYLARPELTDGMYGQLFEIEALIDAAMNVSDCAEIYRVQLECALELVEQVTERLGNKMAVEKTPAPIDRDTHIQHGGEIGQYLMHRCTWGVAAMASLIVQLADQWPTSDDIDGDTLAHQLRGAAIHIHNLNSQLASSFSDDSVTLWDVARTLHCEDHLTTMLQRMRHAEVTA